MKKNKELVLIKLGGSVITWKDSGRPDANRRHIVRLATEIATALRERDFNLVIVHGAGPFGHILAQRHRLHEGLISPKQVGGIALTHHSMEKLNYIVIEELHRAGINAMAYQPSSSGVLKNGRLTEFSVKPLKNLLSLGIVPVTYGDVLFDEKRGCSILSGDQIIAFLAEELSADRIIIAADVAGVYEKDPKKDNRAKLVKEISSDTIGKVKEVGPSLAVDVTGGMGQKISELLRLADAGIESEIIDGTKPGLLQKALLGKKNLGTTIKKGKK